MRRKTDQQVICPACQQPGFRRSRVQIKDGSFNRVYHHVPKEPRQINQYCIVNEPDMTVTPHQPVFSLQKSRRVESKRCYTCKVCELSFDVQKRSQAFVEHQEAVEQRYEERQLWLRKLAEDEDRRVQDNVSILEEK